jgi:hypothetical protein
MARAALTPALPLLFAGLLACAAARADDIVSPPMHLAVGESGGSLVASGRWISRIRRGNTLQLSSVNSVELHCTRGSMTCFESRAELSAGQEGRPAQTLVVKSIPFKVTEWTDAQIVARTDTESGDLMLKVDLRGHVVELSYWDTKPSAKSPADGFVWTLK